MKNAINLLNANRLTPEEQQLIEATLDFICQRQNWNRIYAAQFILDAQTNDSKRNYLEKIIDNGTNSAN
jgi:hypothetical protein